ncbi:MAG: hypothetical protein ACREMX_09855 [Gemmatimonadales bacterium]
MVVWAIAASLACAAASPLAAQQGRRGPCDLLSAAEVAKFLSVPAVQVDSVNTGTNEFTGVELCSWFVELRDPRGLTVRLRREKSAEDTTVLLLAARMEDEFSQRKVEPIAGLGEEAQYADWLDGSGGTVIVRSGPNVVTLTGTISKATAIAMAKTAVPRL